MADGSATRTPAARCPCWVRIIAAAPPRCHRNADFKMELSFACPREKSVLFLGREDWPSDSMQTERRRHPRVNPDSMFRVQAYSADFAENPLHRTNLSLRCLDLSARGA